MLNLSVSGYIKKILEAFTECVHKDAEDNFAAFVKWHVQYKMAWFEWCYSVHTVQRQILAQIPIGFCTQFICFVSVSDSVNTSLTRAIKIWSEAYPVSTCIRYTRIDTVSIHNRWPSCTCWPRQSRCHSNFSHHVVINWNWMMLPNNYKKHCTFASIYVWITFVMPLCNTCLE